MPIVAHTSMQRKMTSQPSPVPSWVQFVRWTDFFSRPVDQNRRWLHSGENISSAQESCSQGEKDAAGGQAASAAAGGATPTDALSTVNGHSGWQRNVWNLPPGDCHGRHWRIQPFHQYPQPIHDRVLISTTILISHSPSLLYLTCSNKRIGLRKSNIWSSTGLPWLA